MCCNDCTRSKDGPNIPLMFKLQWLRGVWNDVGVSDGRHSCLIWSDHEHNQTQRLRPLLTHWGSLCVRYCTGGNGDDTAGQIWPGADLWGRGGRDGGREGGTDICAGKFDRKGEPVWEEGVCKKGRGRGGSPYVSVRPATVGQVIGLCSDVTIIIHFAQSSGLKPTIVIITGAVPKKIQISFVYFKNWNTNITLKNTF